MSNAPRRNTPVNVVLGSFGRRYPRGQWNIANSPAIISANADFAALPSLVEQLTFEFPERQRSDFAGTAKSTQKKSRRLHRESIVDVVNNDVNRRLDRAK